MAHGNIVVQSYNLEGNTVCVDIFMRADGTHGFDEALKDAKQTVAWLNEAIPQ